MKKIYLVALMLILGGNFAFSQGKLKLKDLQVAPAPKTPEILNSNPVNSNSQTAQIDGAERETIIWSDDFSDPLKWTINNDAGNTDDWVIGLDGPAGAYKIAKIKSTTADNGFALFDSDLLCSGNQNANITTANPINLTGYDEVSLRFQQYFRKWYGTTYIAVSSDNVNWTKIEVNQGLANGIYNGGNSANNADIVTVNISAEAGGKSTVWIRFNYESLTEGCDYSWQVDDIAIIPATNDLELNYGFWGAYKPGQISTGEVYSYSKIPHGQQTWQYLGASISNNGRVQNNVVLSGTGSGNAFGFSGTSDPVTPWDVAFTGSISLNDSLLPDFLGGYYIDFNVDQDEVDDEPLNNSGKIGFEVSDTIYARDNDILTNENVWNAADSFACGNKFLINMPGMEATSGTVVMYNWSANVGKKIKMKLVNVTGGAPFTFEEIASTNTYTILDTDIPVKGPNPTEITLGFIGGPVELDTAIGLYYLFVQTYGDSLVIAGSKIPGERGSYVDGLMDTATTWYYTNTIPMIRLNFGGNVYSEPCPTLTIQPTITQATCGYNNGSISVHVDSALYPVKFEWSSSNDSTNKISNLGPGNYVVTATDNYGCFATATYTITNTGNMPSVTLSTVGSTCSQPNGSATATGSGVSPISYLWSNGATTAVNSNILGGTYSVVITDGANCTASASVLVSNKAPATLATSSNPSTCGSNNGLASVQATSGTTPYTYSWSNGETGISIDSLAAGTYNIKVTTADGCISIDSVVVDSASSIVLNLTTANSTCGNSNGSASAVITGGSAVSMLWTPMGGTGLTASGLAAGTFTFTAKDVNNCIATATAVVSNTGSKPIADSIVTDSPDSCGGSTGSATIYVSGGTAPYKYTWAGDSSITNNIDSVKAGNYSVIVEDTIGCVSSFVVSISDPGAPVINMSIVSNINCFGAMTGAAKVSSVTTGLTYTWIPNVSTDSIADSLGAGNYFVIAANGSCMASASINLTQPADIMISAIKKEITCFGLSNGEINVSVAGGVMPYSYLWNGGGSTQDTMNIGAGTYSLVVSDSLGCKDSTSWVIAQPALLVATVTTSNVSCLGGNNGSATVAISGGTTPYGNKIWSNGGTASTVSNLSPGDYSVTVTDLNNCTAKDTGTVSQPSAALAVSVAGTNPFCGGGMTGTTSATVTGGTSPYSYLWSPGAGSGSTFTGLGVGTYSVQVTDNNNCTASGSTILTAPQPMGITLAAPVKPSHSDTTEGAISITITNGNAPYTYSWSNGSTTKDITGLTPGSYSVTVTDANGCIKVSSPFVVAIDYTSIKENKVFSGLSIYPNPASTLLNVNFFTSKLLNGTVKMISITGQTVYSENLKGFKGEYRKSIELEKMPKGLYFLMINSGDGAITRKVIVH